MDGETVPMPPVLGPLSSSSIRLWSCTETMGTTRVPSENTRKETSSPGRNSSITSFAPAVPNFLPSISSATASAASARSLATNVPLPEARPSAFTTRGNPHGAFFTKASADSLDGQTSNFGEGMLWRAMNSRAKTFDPSSSAAARLGQKMVNPRRWNSSAMPSTIGSSGPTTVRSAPIVWAKSASSTMLEVSMGTMSAIPAIPAFPGAQ